MAIGTAVLVAVLAVGSHGTAAHGQAQPSSQVGSGSCSGDRVDTVAYPDGLIAEGHAVCVFPSFTVQGSRVEVHHSGREGAAMLLIANGDVSLQVGKERLMLKSVTLEVDGTE